MSKPFRDLLRPCIRNLIPYSCARNDFSGKADVYLDANENWRDFSGWKSLNRYPDPLCTGLRQRIEQVLGLKAGNTVIGNGSDEIIDNLMRMFCIGGKDKVIIQSPTYGAYRVFADINGVEVVDVPLREDYSMDMEALEKAAADEAVKLLFICSPNNPTSNSFALDEIRQVCSFFSGITIVDEAYFDFSGRESAVGLEKEFQNLVVLRTLSKCWAQAGCRIGILVADEEICSVMVSMKYPYNVSAPAQMAALQLLEKPEQYRQQKEEIIQERGRLAAGLQALPMVEKVFPSDANFLLVKVSDPDGVYHYLADRKIIVRNRSTLPLCSGCLRVTVGSRQEDDALLAALKEWRQ